jgi:ligand-binding SRPBCC domain-containing protein
MPTVDLTTAVDAPLERVFDLARSVDCHVETMADHDERAVDGVTAGLLSAGDEVTWRARHFGVPLRMRVHVPELDRPTHFRDEQVAGPFAALSHDHRFERDDGRTLMHDTLQFRSPADPLGRLVDAAVLGRYMRRLLERRNERFVGVAEGEGWRQFLDP